MSRSELNAPFYKGALSELFRKEDPCTSSVSHLEIKPEIGRTTNSGLNVSPLSKSPWFSGRLKRNHPSFSL